MGRQAALFISGPNPVSAFRSAQTLFCTGGDDAGLIAALFNVSIDELEMLNPGVTSGRCCIPGKVLVIPPAASRSVVSVRSEYGPDDVEQDIGKLVAKYPFVTRDSIGASVLGKPLHLLRIGSGPRHLHVNAALHANEWLTSPCLMSFIEQYAAAYDAGRDWHGHRPEEWHKHWTLWAVPMANPDGVELVQEGYCPASPTMRSCCNGIAGGGASGIGRLTSAG